MTIYQIVCRYLKENGNSRWDMKRPRCHSEGKLVFRNCEQTNFIGSVVDL